MRVIGLWLPLVAYMALIWFLSGESDLPVPATPSDRVLHAVGYALLGGLALRAFHGGWRPARPLPTALAVLLGLTYGALDEWHQSWVPGREPSIGDWIADAAGVVLAALAWKLFNRETERVGG